jgi:hypothetical protein
MPVQAVEFRFGPKADMATPLRRGYLVEFSGHCEPDDGRVVQLVQAFIRRTTASARLKSRTGLSPGAALAIAFSSRLISS